MKRKYFWVWLAVAAAVVSAAQEKGPWRASSTTAASITGDVAFAEDKITINIDSFPVAQIRALTAAELSAVFDAEATAAGKGNLYRVRIAGAQKFLNKNTLCGSDEVDWIASYVSGKTLQLAFFSGQKMPVMSAEVLANSTNLCGTFTYTR
jgi:hypothetical protein